MQVQRQGEQVNGLDSRLEMRKAIAEAVAGGRERDQIVVNL